MATLVFGQRSPDLGGGGHVPDGAVVLAFVWFLTGLRERPSVDLLRLQSASSVLSKGRFRGGVNGPIDLRGQTEGDRGASAPQLSVAVQSLPGHVA
jgi:hypothetical protein